MVKSKKNKILILKPRKRSGNAKKVDAEIKKELNTKGEFFSIFNFEDLEVFMKKSRVSIKIGREDISRYKTIFLRKVGEYNNLAFLISKVAKLNGVSCIDSFYSFTNSTTKLVQMFLLSLAGIPIPKTYYSPAINDKKIVSMINFLNFPIVVKKCGISHGAGVSLAKDRKELGLLIKNNFNKEVIFQEYLENDFDYRILVLNGIAKVAEKRIRQNKKEFRNNIFLGAEEQFVKLNDVPKKVIAIAQKSAIVLKTEVAGADVVVSKNKGVRIFEVNSAPEFTANTKISSEISELINYLIRLNE